MEGNSNGNEVNMDVQFLMNVSLIGVGIVATSNAKQCTLLHSILAITSNSKNSNNKRKSSWSEFWISVNNPMHFDNK